MGFGGGMDLPQEEKEEKKVVVKPEYLDTPGGKKVATFDFAMGLAEAIEILDEAEAELEERVNKLERGEGMAKLLEKFEARIAAIEKTLSSMEKNIQTEMGDLADKLSALIDAFHELAERVQRIEEMLFKG